MPPLGAAKFVYVEISVHNTGLHLSLQLYQDFWKNRSFSEKIGIDRSRSEK